MSWKPSCLPVAYPPLELRLRGKVLTRKSSHSKLVQQTPFRGPQHDVTAFSLGDLGIGCCIDASPSGAGRRFVYCPDCLVGAGAFCCSRSEERRVGKECRSWWSRSPGYNKK